MCADITTTVPVSGKFTPDQKIFYDGVLQAHKDVLVNIKPGAIWTDLHLLSLSDAFRTAPKVKRHQRELEHGRNARKQSVRGFYAARAGTSTRHRRTTSAVTAYETLDVEY